MTNKKGFTLIEVLIATTILAVVMAALFSSFRAGLFGYRDIDARVQVFQAARQFFDRLNLDVRNCIAYSAEDTKFKGDAARLSFLTSIDTFRNSEMSAEIALVEYTLTGQSLTRLCRRNQDALRSETDITPDVFVENVEEFSLQFGYIPSGETELAWKPLWDDPVALPVCVKVTLRIGGKGPQKFERTIYFASHE